MIDINKKYRTRDGLPVRLLCTDLKNNYSVVGIITFFDGEEELKSWRYNGKYINNNEHNWDLVEITPWDDFKIDEPVMVCDQNSKAWEKRHFAGVDKKGKPLVWPNGKTSWTTFNLENSYARDFCRRPTAEELNK